MESGSLGYYEREEMDPGGAEVGTEDPWANQLQEEPTYENLKDDEPLYIEGGDPFDYSTRGIAFGMPIVTVDGIRATQSQVNRIIRDSGASRFVLFDVTVPFKPLDGARNITVPIAGTWGVALPPLPSLRRNIPQRPQPRFDDSLGPPPPVPTLGFTGNQDVLDDLYCLWKKAGYGSNATERSLWITKNGNNYGSVPWPRSAEMGKETWKGPLPAGTVAIAHTHPDKSSPKTLDDRWQYRQW